MRALPMSPRKNRPEEGGAGSAAAEAAAGGDAGEPEAGYIERARLAAIVDSSEYAILSKTLDGIITSWNAAAERLYGYTAEEAVGRHISFIFPPELAGQAEEIHARVSRGERVEHLETVRVRKDGSRVEVSVSVSPVKDPSGRIVGAATITRDITERRRASAALRESMELNRAVMDSQPAHIAVLDRDGRVIAVNEAWRRFAAENGGAEAASGVGADYIAVCRDAAPEAARAIREVIEGAREGFTFEYPCHSPREKRWFLLNASPLSQGGGAVVSHIDITERKRAEEATAELLRERERMIEEVSTPLVPVLEGVLVLPLVGSLDTERTARATAAALEAVTRQGARTCIIDITGARVVDSHAVASLTNLVRALRLVGADACVTGIGIRAAQTLVGLGLDMEGLRTYRTLAQALAEIINSRAARARRR